ncbi:MAG: dihydroorotate dehydrogenase-like protein [Verrucomicrobiota bacterium]
MNLATNYLGLSLRNPLIVGASPFCDEVDGAQRLQDAGAAAIVMRSLFEEQIDHQQRSLSYLLDTSPGEILSGVREFFPAYSDYPLTPNTYLDQVNHLKNTLKIPVIASLNGHRPGAWTDYAHKLEQAGADAIELNLYHLVTDPRVSGRQVEDEMLETVRNISSVVKIPVAAKISPFHAAPVQFALELEKAGAKGVVLFNRFYQPDFDLQELEVLPQLKLSDSSELLLRLRWLAVISPHLKASLGCTGGVHSTVDIVKALLAGAHTVQIVSVLLKEGPRVLTQLLAGMRHWMETRGYANLDELRGVLNLRRCPHPEAHERANYIKMLQSRPA